MNNFNMTVLLSLNTNSTGIVHVSLLKMII